MIRTTVPTSLRRPGAYHEFRFNQAGQALVPITERVALVGTMSPAGTATVAAPVQIFDEADGDEKAGKGSELALMVRAAFAQAKLIGFSPEIWICPIAEPGGGTAAVQTITVTVTTALAGTIVLRIAGRTLNVGVTAGDSVTTIASAIKSEIDRVLESLPVTATSALGVVTATHLSKGENGNDVAYEVVSKPGGVTVTPAQLTAGVGVVDITAAVDALLDKDYSGIAIANHKAADVTDAVAHVTAAWGPTSKRYRWLFMGERSTLSAATTLSAAANDKGVLVISCEACPNLPGELAATAAIAEFAIEAPNVNRDGVKLALYPPAAASAYTSAEVESALAAGATPLTPTYEGDALQIESLITTKTTEASAPFDLLRDIAYSRTAAYMARQCDIGYRTGFTQETLTPEVMDRIRDMVVAKHFAAESAGYLRDVESLLGEIQVVAAAAPLGRVLVTSPIKVAGPLHQGVFIHTLYL